METALKRLTLPQGATSKIIPLNLNESAAISYAIESPTRNLTDLTKLAKDEIVSAIAKLPGVLKVSLLGGATATAPLNPANVGAATIPKQGQH